MKQVFCLVLLFAGAMGFPSRSQNLLGIATCIIILSFYSFLHTAEIMGGFGKVQQSTAGMLIWFIASMSYYCAILFQLTGWRESATFWMPWQTLLNARTIFQVCSVHVCQLYNYHDGNLRFLDAEEDCNAVQTLLDDNIIDCSMSSQGLCCIGQNLL